MDKLVRDRIPELIRESGKTPMVEVLGETDYAAALNQKLAEEVAEYLEDNCLEELCDILEVVYALLEAKGISREKAEAARLEKADRNGAFQKRLYLKEILP